MANGIKEQQEKRRRARKNITIGVLIDSPHSKQNRMIQKQIQTYADEHRTMKTEILDISESTIDTETAIDILLGKKIDTLIIYEYDTNFYDSIIDKATQHMLPLVFFYYAPPSSQTANPNIENNSSIVVVSASNQEIGRMQAKFLLDTLRTNNIGSGNIGLLTGNVGETTQIERTNSFSDYIAQYSNNTISITQTQSARWKESDAIPIVENWLKNDNLIAIVSNNDAMILGASIPIREQEIEGIILIGAEGIEDAISSVKKSYIQASIYIDTKQMLSTALETADKVARGDTVQQVTHTPLALITQENIDQFGDK